MKDTIQVSTSDSAERVFSVMSSLEMIKQWEPLHNLPLVRHEWKPDTSTVKKGQLLRIISPLWVFGARCAEVKEAEGLTNI